MTLIACPLSVPDVMTHLAAQRPVFHPEADFQFAFAQAAADLDATIRIRLAVPKRAARNTFVDSVCTGEIVSLHRVQVPHPSLGIPHRVWTGSSCAGTVGQRVPRNPSVDAVSVVDRRRAARPRPILSSASSDLASYRSAGCAARRKPWLSTGPMRTLFVAVVGVGVGEGLHGNAYADDVIPRREPVVSITRTVYIEVADSPLLDDVRSAVIACLNAHDAVHEVTSIGSDGPTTALLRVRFADHEQEVTAIQEARRAALHLTRGYDVN